MLTELIYPSKDLFAEAASFLKLRLYLRRRVIDDCMNKGSQSLCCIGKVRYIPSSLLRFIGILSRSAYPGYL